ncbi:thiolase family protein [Campylobacter helveticus]|uniref:thiolase family protein n=1 Tax=Campylobacter helveticus TaxID=28898 RepID=UPI0021499B78|nr:acetyl-CoA C-acyltransferase [Campylobacter helveticus]MCR2062613.1 acetyl-CoA C-acyltransferase [Campylobacter helveticus]
MKTQEVVIMAAKRTAIGSFLGSLKQTTAVQLASSLSQSLLDEVGLDKNLIDELILGQVLGAGCGQNVARQVLINSGVSLKKTAFVVNMLCGSGLKAVQLGFDSIRFNNANMLLCGGVENMSLSPFLLENARLGYKMGHQNLIDSMIKDGIWCALSDCHMGITAENLAKKYELSREEQDEFALNSQLKASKAIENKAFGAEILPLKIQDKKKEFIFSEDEFVRKDANLEALSRLKPAFDKNGSVTAGNSSGVNDGAAMLLLSSKEKALELNLPILAKLKGFASAGVEPSIMGIGAAFAAKKVLKELDLSIDDMELIEANEAFAAQSLATLRELGADVNRVNVNGGAIALGHPIGASGARILVSLIYALRARGKNLGLATLCVGGGQGIAAVVEIER